MTPLQRNSLGVAILLAASTGVLLLTRPEELPAAAPDEVQLDLSKRACLPDGGKACVALYAQPDGGQAWRQLACDCVRQPLQGGDCMALRGDAGVDLGPGTRFSASEAAGAECEAVPCSVFSGTDPDSDSCDVPWEG